MAEFELGYNVTGSERKRLVTAITEITGCAAQLISHWGQLKACDSYNFRLFHFDNFVNIKKCKEVLSNDCKSKQRTLCIV